MGGGRIVEAAGGAAVFRLNRRGNGQGDRRSSSVKAAGGSAGFVVSGGGTAADVICFRRRTPILDEILEQRSGRHLVVGVVKTKGAAELLPGIEVGDGRLRGKDGRRGFQAEKVEEFFDETKEQASVGSR